MTDNGPLTAEEAAHRRDELILKMASQAPMTHDELKAKLAASRPAKKGREPKPAPKAK